MSISFSADSLIDVLLGRLRAKPTRCASLFYTFGVFPWWLTEAQKAGLASSAASSASAWLQLFSSLLDALTVCLFFF